MAAKILQLAGLLIVVAASIAGFVTYNSQEVGDSEIRIMLASIFTVAAGIGLFILGRAVVWWKR